LRGKIKRSQPSAAPTGDLCHVGAAAGCDLLTLTTDQQRGHHRVKYHGGPQQRPAADKQPDIRQVQRNRRRCRSASSDTAAMLSPAAASRQCQARSGPGQSTAQTARSPRSRLIPSSRLADQPGREQQAPDPVASSTTAPTVSSLCGVMKRAGCMARRSDEFEVAGGAILADELGGFFTDHHGRCGGAASNDSRHDRGVDHAQTLAGHAPSIVRPRRPCRRCPFCRCPPGGRACRNGRAATCSISASVFIGASSTSPRVEGLEGRRRHDFLNHPIALDQRLDVVRVSQEGRVDQRRRPSGRRWRVSVARHFSGAAGRRARSGRDRDTACGHGRRTWRWSGPARCRPGASCGGGFDEGAGLGEVGGQCARCDAPPVADGSFGQCPRHPSVTGRSTGDDLTR
jgi:hypothetical protein